MQLLLFSVCFVLLVTLLLGFFSGVGGGVVICLSLCLTDGILIFVLNHTLLTSIGFSVFVL